MCFVHNICKSRHLQTPKWRKGVVEKKQTTNALCAQKISVFSARVIVWGRIKHYEKRSLRSHYVSFALSLRPHSGFLFKKVPKAVAVVV